ncbi:MAG TPA: hypothetical protein VM802_19905 [Chitinophaga sp.]|uniref:hypothetical protein n=1 Tax=Chitinophaga sp. TaxID=1869181 RepID=UPI002B575C5B|nr:hypothetical protein [Chitinophaga sp.]HVI47152.1 hypothetical protein [Chitinophaga sp.]
MNVARTAAVAVVSFIMLVTLYPSAAQQQPQVPARQLSLPTGAIRLDSLGAMVARQTGLVFSFNARKVSPQTKVLPPKSRLGLNELLTWLGDRYQLHYKIYGNHIIIHNEPVVAANATAAVSTAPAALSVTAGKVPPRQRGAANKQLITPPVTRKGTTAPGVPGAVAGKAPEKRIPVKDAPTGQTQQPVAGTSRLVNTTAPTIPEERPSSPAPGYASLEALKGITLPSPKVALQVPPVPLAVNGSSSSNGNGGGGKRGLHIGFGMPRLYAAAGVSIDETFYANPVVNVGITWLYAVVGWRTNFSTAGFYYGLGTSLKLSEKWGIHLSATTGNLSKDFKNVMPIDTFVPTRVVTLKGTVTKINLLAEKDFGKHWRLQFGPAASFMKTDYYYNGRRVPLESVLRPGENSKPSDFHLVNPIYTISDKYTDSAMTNRKVWVDLHVGLIYRFR